MDELELYILLNYLKNLMHELKEEDDIEFDLTMKQINDVLEYNIERMKNLI